MWVPQEADNVSYLPKGIEVMVKYFFRRMGELQIGRGQELAVLNPFCNVPSNSALAQTSPSYSAHQLTASVLLGRQVREHPLFPNLPLEMMGPKQHNHGTLSNHILTFVRTGVLAARHHLPFTPGAV